MTQAQRFKQYFFDRTFLRDALRLSLPVALQNLLTSSCALVDTAMVSRLGGVELSSVGMAGQWSWLLALFLFGVSSGSTVFIAQYWGVKDKKRIHGIMGICLILALAISLVFTFVGFFASENVLRIFNSDPAVVASGASYLKIACLSYPALALYLMLGTVLRSTENVKLPMFMGFFTALLNALLNYSLIFGRFGFPEMGVRGAAAATCISTWAGLVLMIIISISTRSIICAPLSDIFGFDRAMFKKYLRISSPVILNESLWGFGVVCYNIVFARLGYEEYAAMTIYRTIESLVFVFFVGLCSACAIMVGKSVGAGDMQKARQDAVRFTVMVPFSGLITGALVAIFRFPLIEFFNTGGNMSEKTLATASSIMIIYGLELFLRNIPYITIVGVFRSGGDTVTGMIYDLVCVWLIALPLMIVCAFLIKLPFAAVFASMLFGEDIVKFFLCIRRFKSMKWIRRLTADSVQAEPVAD